MVYITLLFTSGYWQTLVPTSMMRAYPSLKGVTGTGSANVEGPGGGNRPRREEGKDRGDGHPDPKDVRAAIDHGAVAGVVSYDEAHLGYLTYWAVSQLLAHRALHAHDTVPGLSAPVTWTPATHTLLLRPPILVTKANVNKLDF